MRKLAFCTEIVCDGCSNTITRGTIVTKGRMIQLARSEGWSVGKFALCPDCKQKRRQLIKEGWLS